VRSAWGTTHINGLPFQQVEVGPGQHTRYTLLVYLSGQDPSGSSSTGSNASSSAAAATEAAASSGGGGRSKRAGAGTKQPPGGGGGAAAAAVAASAVQPLRGGETIFYGDRSRVLAAVSPQPGLALLHLHGEDKCLEHEAAAVLSGTKYVLRSDVVFSAV